MLLHFADPAKTSPARAASVPDTALTRPPGDRAVDGVLAQPVGVHGSVNSIEFVNTP
jgi:hypothetical protein